MTPRPPFLVRTAYDPMSPFTGRDRDRLPDRLTRMCDIDLRARVLDATRYDVDFDATDTLFVAVARDAIWHWLALPEDNA